MFRRLTIATALACALSSVMIHAQVTGVAFATLAGSTEFVGGELFVGPWRATQTALKIRYNVVCIDTVDQTHKATVNAIATIPNGSTMAQILTISTTAIVTGCASPGDEQTGVTVPRGAVVLPAFSLGQ